MKRGNDLIESLREHGGVIVEGDPCTEDGCFFRLLGGLRVCVSWGSGWDHVSVSRVERCPTWAEMERVRAVVSLPGEVWLQYGMPDERHINTHPHCLHWWRPQDLDIHTPPSWMV